jgi:hypothetical protein
MEAVVILAEASDEFTASITRAIIRLQGSRWKEYDSPKRWYLPTRRHRVTTHRRQFYTAASRRVDYID